MKDFWWRRRTDPPPVQLPHHVEFKTPDAGSTLWNASKTPGTSRWGSRAKRCFESLNPTLKDPGKDHVSEAVAGENEMAGSAVDRLQETIRFVFSHEQEGLLAIGTFALDQLAGVRVDIDVNNQLKPPEAVSTTDQNICQRNNSTNNSEFQSETEFQQSSLSRNNLELPVYDDHDALSDLHPRTLPVVETTKPLPIAPVLKHNSASTFNLSTGSSNLDDTECTTELYESDEEVCRRGVCGLFGSRSRRKQKLGEKENRKQLPPEKQDGVEKDAIDLQASVKPERSKGFKIGSLGRLWRSGRGRPPLTHQVSPVPELSPTATLESTQVPRVPCIANVEPGGGPGAAALKYSRDVPCQPVPYAQKTGEAGERVRRASFGSGAWAYAQSGKWIRTDSEFVVLEM